MQMNRDLTRTELSSLLLIVALVTLLAYYPGMSADFYFDDEPNLLEVTALHWGEVSFASIRRALEDSFLPSRPVANISMALNHWFSGLDPAPYHWTNLVIHLCVGLTLYWVIRLFQKNYSDIPGSQWIALLAVLLFLVHPLNIQAVTYMVQRMTLLAALFVLLGLGCYLTGRCGAPTGRRSRWFALTALCFLVAVGSKEIGLLLLPLLLLYELSFHRAEWCDRYAALVGRVGRPVVWVAGAMLLVTATAMGWQLFADHAYWSEIMPGRDFSGQDRLLTQGRVQFFYLSLLLWPSPARLNLDHDILVSRSLLDPVSTSLTLAGLVLIVVFAIRWLPARPHLAFPILAYLMLHSVESAPINLELSYEHRMYLPMTMLALMLAMNVRPVGGRAVYGRFAALLVIVILFGVFTYQRNQVWGDPVALYGDAARKSPGKYRPNYNLGTELGKVGRLDEARDALERALTIEPDNSKAHNQLANVHLLHGDPLSAERHYRLAVQYEPTNAEALYNLASLLGSQRRFAEQRAILEQFVLHAPPYLEEQKKSALSLLGR
jgi:hypothetical protein